MANKTKALEAHVDSYCHSKSMLKAKLTMSKRLLNMLTFIAAKDLLSNFQQSINDRQVEGNLFSHSGNPLLCMCLLYELLNLIM